MSVSKSCLKQPLIKSNTKIHIVEQVQSIDINNGIKVDQRRFAEIRVGKY